MAHITKRGAYQWQAQVRRKGLKPENKTFETKKDAQAWATAVESEMDRGIFVSRTEVERITLRDALARYLKEVTPTKRVPHIEAARIRRLMTHPISYKTLATLQAKDFANYRNERSKVVGRNTIRLELAVFSHLFTVARKEWSLPVVNYVSDIKKPAPGEGRTRRLGFVDMDGLSKSEETLLLAAAKSSKAKNLHACISLAIETGMREGELVGLTWTQIDLANKVIQLETEKNGDARAVPLNKAAEGLLRSLPTPVDGGRLTDFYDGAGLSRAFGRLCKKLSIVDLTFHDLRHEAASRFAPSMEAPTLAKVMGWKTLQMAMRYYNPTPADLVAAVRGFRGKAAVQNVCEPLSLGEAAQHADWLQSAPSA